MSSFLPQETGDGARYNLVWMDTEPEPHIGDLVSRIIIWDAALMISPLVAHRGPQSYL